MIECGKKELFIAEVRPAMHAIGWLRFRQVLFSMVVLTKVGSVAGDIRNSEVRKDKRWFNAKIVKGGIMVVLGHPCQC